MEEFVSHTHSSVPSPTSKYVADSSVFYRERKAPLLVLVEDEDDIPFWKRMFNCVSGNYLEVGVFSLKKASENALQQKDANGNSLVASGKDALMKVSGLGKFKVVAVDADYDLLVDYHSYSDSIRNDKYVIHTEYYSIENHLLEAKTMNLLSIWQHMKTVVSAVDWDNFFNGLADALGNAVKLCVASNIHRQNLYHQGTNPLPDTFSVNEISSALGAICFSPTDYWTSLSKWQTSIEGTSHFAAKQRESSAELLAFASWQADDVLHNLQGHTLYCYIFQLVKLYFKKGYKQLIDDEKAKVSNNAEILSAIHALRIRIGMADCTVDGFIKHSIYSASALDMNDKAIMKIQNNIRAILN
ncbi:MAG: DUF4435 domain-containing protein [Bacteroidales bacterium]|nr:DUF4435 domain-containing protein [Bacteroidales bacterium]